jgi:Fe2+ or Zn2+ uptake regulation protein
VDKLRGGLTMIDKSYGEYHLICDSCGYNEVFRGFDEAVEYKKQSGWRSTKHKGEWHDICPSCVEEEIYE